jgi:hypothetical protein
MAVGKWQSFFGDDLEDTFDSLKSAPGAFGNILVAAARQVRPVDLAAFSLVVAGFGWLIAGYGIAADHRAGLLLLSLLPLALWLTAGLTAGFIFHISGIGYRSLTYWESYLLIASFSLFGLISLRLALNPKDRRIYRMSASGPDL